MNVLVVFQGMSSIVEIDESAFGKTQKYGRGKPTTKTWLFGIAQRGTRMARFFVVPDRKNSTLHPILEQHVARTAKNLSR